MKDSAIPFVFDAIAARGTLVQLESTWQRMQREHNYATPVAKVLGEAAAAAVLLAQSLKFSGTVTLQINSEGPLGMLVMQSTDSLELRGMSTSTTTINDATFAELTTNSRCAVTIDAGAMERPYQGIVEVHPTSLGDSLENYFAQSVQIPSHLILFSQPAYCGGILVQQLPGERAVASDDWRRIRLLLATLRAAELAPGATPELLHKLFAEDDVRVFSPRNVRFNCSCSQSKVEDVLRMLGEEKTRATLEEDGHIDVTCEYCGQMRRFDTVDVGRVFGKPVQPGNQSLH